MLRGVFADDINGTLKVKENADGIINLDSALCESHKRPREHKESAAQT